MYRGQANAILMQLVGNPSRFTGLVGKHSTEREVETYDNDADEVNAQVVPDDNYPNAAFLCIPEINMIACQDRATLTAKSAIARLHAILAHRTRITLVGHPLRQSDDLRFAIDHFRVVEVDFEVLPVNPHTGDAGRLLDENNKRDHVAKMRGKLLAEEGGRIELGGGTATQIQQLQQSGHARVGYKGFGPRNVEINVSKPHSPSPKEEDDEESDESYPEMRITFPHVPPTYPLPREHVEELERMMRIFARQQ